MKFTDYPGLKVHAERHFFGGGIGLYFYKHEQNGDMVRVKNVEFEVIPAMESSAIHQDPDLAVDMTTAQSLMDELWNCGIRPTEGTGSAGSLAATERHLKDMQNIVYHKLGINK